MSVTVRFDASAGPAFVIVSVYVSVSPGSMIAADATLTICRSTPDGFQVGVQVGVAVSVGVAVGVSVSVGVGVSVAVGDGVQVAVAGSVGVWVGVEVGV